VFTNVANGVQVVITLQNCAPGLHGIHIHEGTSCATEQAQGMHWGGTNGPGEGIGSGTGLIMCDNAMTANLTYVRANTPASTRWTIGPPAATNLIGHAVVVHNIDPGTARHACGVIQAVN
jgi:Cu/Zn superoxide dismutase